MLQVNPLPLADHQVVLTVLWVNIKPLKIHIKFVKIVQLVITVPLQSRFDAIIAVGNHFATIMSVARIQQETMCVPKAGYNGIHFSN